MEPGLLNVVTLTLSAFPVTGSSASFVTKGGKYYVCLANTRQFSVAIISSYYVNSKEITAPSFLSIADKESALNLKL